MRQYKRGTNVILPIRWLYTTIGTFFFARTPDRICFKSHRVPPKWVKTMYYWCIHTTYIYIYILINKYLQTSIFLHVFLVPDVDFRSSCIELRPSPELERVDCAFDFFAQVRCAGPGEPPLLGSQAKEFTLTWWPKHLAGQMKSRPHTTSPQMVVREIPVFQGNLGWWYIIDSGLGILVICLWSLGVELRDHSILVRKPK